MSLLQDQPQDLLYCVLVLLPIKTLLKCKRVCKSLCDLIKDYEFVKFYCRHNFKVWSSSSKFMIGHVDYPGEQSSHLSAILIRCISGGPRLVGYPLPQYKFLADNNVRLIGSSTGILCFITDLHKEIVLWGNPLMIQNSGLRISPPCSVKPFSFGFGYDNVSHDFKVAWLGEFEDRSGYCAAIFSLKSNKWTKVSHDFEHGPTLHHAVLVGGAFHWVSKDSLKIIALDLDSEKFHQVPVPSRNDWQPGRTKIQKLAVLNDWLAMTTCHDNGLDACYFHIWFMKIYGIKDSWVKIVLPISVCATPMAYEKSQTGEIIIIRLPCAHKDQFWFYDIVNQSLVSVLPLIYSFSSEVFIGYGETFAFINSMQQEKEEEIK